MGRDIQLGQKVINREEMNNQEREPRLGETTLEDYLVKAGLFVADASLGHTMSLDNPTALQSFVPPIGLSPSPSLSDTPVSGRKRGATDIDKTIDRRLRRKIKNRESAARSRARKQVCCLLLIFYLQPQFAFTFLILIYSFLWCRLTTMSW